MAVKIRLTRMGAKKKPVYRIVASDSRRPRDGQYIELVGTYNPLTTPATVNIQEEVAMKWLKNGAEPTDTVRNLFSEAGIMKKFAESKGTKAKKEAKPKKEVKEEKKAAPKKAEAKKAPAKKTTTKKATKKEAE